MNVQLRYFLISLCLILFGVTCILALEEIKQGDPVVLTHEWQSVDRDQSIPKGAHIKINLETGERLVKIASSSSDEIENVKTDTSKEINLNIHQNKQHEEQVFLTGIPDEMMTSLMEFSALQTTEENQPNEDGHSSSVELIRRTFAHLPDEELQLIGLSVNVEEVSDEKLEAVWEERQQLLKEVMAAMSASSDILNLRIGILKNESATQSQLEATLEDLEDWLGDIDMARDFYKLGGWPILTQKLLNSNSQKIRTLAAWGIGTAVKNDPEFQLWALDKIHDKSENSVSSTTISLLLDAVKDRLSSEELQNKAIFAISSIIRANNEVQKVFVELDGVKIMNELFGYLLSNLNTNTISSGQWTTILKIVTLFSDMIGEDLVMRSLESKEFIHPIVPHLKTENYCTMIGKSILHPKLQGKQVALNAIMLSFEFCHSSFKSNEDMILNLQELSKELNTIISLSNNPEDHIEFTKDILLSVDVILSNVI